LGWLLSKERIPGYEVKTAEHSGYINHFHSRIIILPEYKLGIVILANFDEAVEIARQIATKALELALEEKNIKEYKKGATKVAEQDLQKYIGNYAALGMLGQLVYKKDTFFVKVKYASLRLVANADNTYSIKAYWFGFIPFTPKSLKQLNLSFDTADGRDVIMTKQDGYKLVIGEKITALPLPNDWNALNGTYTIVNPKELPQFISEQVVMQTKNGFLTLDIKAMNKKVQLVILPISATEGIVAGLGIGAGNTVTIKTGNGQQYILYSGLEFKKIK